MKIIFFVCCFIISLAVHGQHIIAGKVADAETAAPVPGISVFVSNTSIGTVTANDGSYRLNVPPGKYEVIFSAVNYITRVLPSDAADSFTIVRLVPRIKELQEVIIRKYDPDGWRNWGQFFLNNFIGVNQFSDECSLENPKALRFYHDKKTGVVTVTATEVLLIENRALGYILKYQLEEFVYDSRTKIVYYEGYPLFEEMQGNERKIRRWKQHRLEAYEGSQLHFMRALYRNRLAEEAFEVHHLRKIKNEEKERIRRVIQSGNRQADSSSYYDRILSQPDEYDVMQPAPLSGDSIAFALDSLTAGLSFPHYLDILYTKKKTPAKYQLQFPKMPMQRVSQVTLLDVPYVQVQADGSFYPTRNLLNLGYWSWSEKISGLLPFDYKPWYSFFNSNQYR